MEQVSNQRFVSSSRRDRQGRSLISEDEEIVFMKT